MKTIDLAALATVTGGAGFFDRFKAPPQKTVVAGPGGVAIGGDVIGSTITMGNGTDAPGKGFAVQGDIRGGSIVNGKYYP